MNASVIMKTVYIYMNNKISKTPHGIVFKRNEAFMFPTFNELFGYCLIPHFTGICHPIYRFKHARSSTMTFWQGDSLLMMMYTEIAAQYIELLMRLQLFFFVHRGANISIRYIKVLRNWFSSKIMYFTYKIHIFICLNWITSMQRTMALNWHIFSRVIDRISLSMA